MEKTKSNGLIFMRLLFLAQAITVSDHPGYDDSFYRLLEEGILKEYKTIPYYGFAGEHGWPAFFEHAHKVASSMEAETVFLQFFHGPIPSPAIFIQQLQKLPSRPTIFTSCGDGFGMPLSAVPRSLIQAAANSDLTFSTGMGRLAKQLSVHGARNIVLMPNGYCQVRFGSEMSYASIMPDFDVVFIGSLLHKRNFLSHGFWANRNRSELVKVLTQRFGRRFGLFGHGWDGNPCWQGPVSYSKQVEACQRGRVVFGGYPNATTDYYTSDRVFINMISGVPMVDYRTPRVDRFFVDGSHWFLFGNKEEMVKQIDRLLDVGDFERKAIGQKAAEFCRTRHSQYHRVRLMVEIASKVRVARLSNCTPPLPNLDFFHDEIKLIDEYPYAVYSWI